VFYTKRAKSKHINMTPPFPDIVKNQEKKHFRKLIFNRH